MALTEERITSNVECLTNNFHIIRIQEKDIVKKDGVHFAESNHRRELAPGHKDSDGNYVKTDTSNETHAAILSIIGSCWTGVNDQAYAEHIGAVWTDE